MTTDTLSLVFEDQFDCSMSSHHGMVARPFTMLLAVAMSLLAVAYPKLQAVGSGVPAQPGSGVAEVP